MSDSDNDIENLIQAKGKTHLRLTPAIVESEILTEYYFNAGSAVDGSGYINGKDSDQCRQSLNLLTICVLTLRNGFTVTGESACAHPENFDEEIGRRVARQHAINKIWPLMGYELRTRIAQLAKEQA